MQEFGKVKIYLPPQSEADLFPKEVPPCALEPAKDQHNYTCCQTAEQLMTGPLQEFDQRQQRAKELQLEVGSTGDTVKQLQKGAV